MESPSILICDAFMHEVRDVVAQLKAAGYRIIVAHNGKDVCDRATVVRPDLVLMEARLPVMDGLAACRMLAAHADTAHIPIIFMSAASSLSDRLAGLRAGAVDYIAKPAHPEEVLLRIQAQLTRQRLSTPAAAPQGTAMAVESGHSGPNRSTQTALVHAFIHLLNHSADHGEEPGAELHIDRLITRLGSNRAALNEAFRSTLDTSVFGWLREQRLLRARHWLARSTLSIQQIAADLGYSSSANFATSFKERFGLSPRAYRQSVTDPRPSVSSELSYTASAEPPPPAEQKPTAAWPAGPLDLSLTANPWSLLVREGQL